MSTARAFDGSATGDARADILIVGGGVGGCAAALAATDLGCRVILTEPTQWIGGQLTSQAVPPDEHRWIERTGRTARYTRFREQVRAWYRRQPGLTEAARLDRKLNPGAGAVSSLCHEPRVALTVLESMLAPARQAGRLDVRLGRKPIATEVQNDRVREVTFHDASSNRQERVIARYVLDATELGDLLPMTGAEYRVGAESKDDFGEPHALDGPADPRAVQAITWCFPLASDPAPGAEHVIDKPGDYDFWRSYVPQMAPSWSGPLLSWQATDPFTLGVREMALYPDEAEAIGRESAWLYRRIVAAQHYSDDARPHEVTLVNWPQNDYWLGSIIDVPDEEARHHLHAARQLSRSLVYWLQTEAPRPDGRAGYPELYLRPDLTGTPDGLAMQPYIRESRRIVAQHTVTELDVGIEARGGYPVYPDRPRPKQPVGLRAEPYADTVGVGSYRIDLHPDTAGHNYVDVASLPYQIPMRAMLPVRLSNLLPACKNIGVSHIANGCFRLQPAEWNIGEVAGFVAAYCLNLNLPVQAASDPDHLAAIQQGLSDAGVQLAWPEDVVPVTKPQPRAVAHP